MLEHLRAELSASDNYISFARYMDLVLYAPGLGYYSAGNRKFGADGDFVTAPELSPLFSRCLARQAAEVLARLKGGDLLEVGAGSGVMACDILRELARLEQLPQRYFILEVSAELRQRQQALLSREVPQLFDRVAWLDALPVSGFRGMVLGNEVLDAMPAERFMIDGEGVQQCGVRWSDNGPAWSTRPLPHDHPLAKRVSRLMSELPASLPEGYVSELNLAAEAWIASISAAMTEGVVLLIDYGFPRREFYHIDRNQGTLMCHYRHRSHPDPFVWPGLQDITTHVDFTAIADAGTANGFNLAGYTTQAYFLLASGLEQMISASDPEQVRQHLELTQQVKKLTLPNEMGELFKVIGFAKAYNEPLRGFSLLNQQERL
jgi:SAM-dependent MidA family methyltransferase